LSSYRIGIGTPEHQHAEAARIAYGCDESRPDGASHRRLYDRYFDAKTIA
jgi:hypothetical protein